MTERNLPCGCVPPRCTGHSFPSNLANMLREMANPQRTDEAQRNPGPLLLRAADEIERLQAVLTSAIDYCYTNRHSAEMLTSNPLQNAALYYLRQRLARELGPETGK